MSSRHQRVVKVGAFTLTAMLLYVVSPRYGAAQTITIHLLNARSGKPMAKKNVTVLWPGGMTSTAVPIDELGIGTFEVPNGRSEFILMGGPRVGEEPYRIAYLNCNEAVGQAIQVARVIEKGIVPANTCGHATIDSRPGEIVFWALPKPWWQPDFQ